MAFITRLLVTQRSFINDDVYNKLKFFLLKFNNATQQ